MKVVFIDDECFTELGNTFSLFQNFYGRNNIYAFERSEEAIEFLKTKAKIIDLAFIDQIIAGSSLNGLQLGQIILETYPHIASIMLTGGSANLTTCQEAMRIGFCDFLDKASDISPRKELYSVLERIPQLPSVISKQKLKKQLFDFRFAIEEATYQANTAQKKFPLMCKIG